MKFKFDAGQQYQLDAIQSIVDIFEGQPLERSVFEMEVVQEKDQLQIDGNILVGNNLILDGETITKNVHSIQSRNGLELSAATNGLLNEGLNFSIEMETGTGKTYVYLRTIHELHQKYGFKKFLIVVPSIAIREGVLSNLENMREHFALLFDNPKVDSFVYDPKKRGKIRAFGKNNSLQIMVINIDSFAKSDNVIFQKSDFGVPAEFVQGVRPIVIVDEPQNMETDIRRQAIRNLNPLCTLRYSATHKFPYNLMYKLDPVQAYDLGLVKMIEVDSIFSEDAYNEAFLEVLLVRVQKRMVTAKLVIDKGDTRGLQRQEVQVSIGDDLFTLSGEREVYKDGFVVEEIDVENKRVIFTNGRSYQVGERNESLRDEIMKYQIRRTVENHFEKEKKLQGLGIKVLSLFFIDKVANYREYTDSGWEQGKFARWFEEAFKEVGQKSAYRGLLEYSAEEVHNGYFAQDKGGSWKDSRGDGVTKDDGDTYELIMKDKGRLLESSTPLRFIFSHSALREGWDNPNIFQICTLNETTAIMKKRQEIGRGLRLPVDQDGNRIFDQSVNVLTVIANQNYDQFARELQTEIEEETGVSFGGRIKNKKARKAVSLRKGYSLDENFKDLWSRISQKTQYHVEYSTDELIDGAWKKCLDLPIAAPKILSARAGIVMSEKGVEARVKNLLGKRIEWSADLTVVPDVVSSIQKRTKLTKHTIFQILKNAELVDKVSINPQQVMDEVSVRINETMIELMVDGIKYEKIDGELWEMTRFENEELEEYLERLVVVEDANKTLYDYIVTDSEVEKSFAKALESREDVRFYFKLPRWFKINTPLGGYNPDWAIVFENDKRIYFVAETKGEGELRPSEQRKIDCGKAHFSVLDGVRFERVRELEEIQID